MKTKTKFELIREWAQERGIYDKGDVKTQYCKLGEEFGEVGKAIIKNNGAELIDGIGDMVVVLTNLAHLAGFTIEDCIDVAYNEIKNRKGKMENGSFIKEETNEYVKDVVQVGLPTGRLFKRVMRSSDSGMDLMGRWRDGNVYKEISTQTGTELVLYLQDEDDYVFYVPAKYFELVIK